jgi:CelD/BcsL family acetyltransferase involved in cellulose biosynthesis
VSAPLTETRPFSIRVVSDPCDFQSLAGEWNALLEASSARSVFLTWEWLSTWWKHLSDGEGLEVVSVRSCGELVGLAPFALRRRQLVGWMSAPTLEFLGNGSVGSDYLDVIVRRTWEQEAERALTERLSRGAVLLRLSRMRQGAIGCGIAARLQGRGWTLNVSQTDVCPFIPLSGHTWESYLASLGAEHRYNVRRKLKKLSQRFEVSFDEATDEPSRREAMSVLLSLHEERWKQRGGSEAFHTRGLLSFHEEWSALALARGWLRLFVLRLDGRPAAALYALRYGPAFSFYQSGFDPAFGRESLGLVCMALSIKRAIEEGASEYDLLHGDEAYKFHWAKHSRPLASLELFPPRASGRAWQTALRLSRGAKRAARRIFPPSLTAMVAEARRSRARKGLAGAQPA